LLAPLNGLRAFEAVARHESFTRAAQELAVSQSAVSHQIRNLEGFLRTRLFERSGLTLALTQEGQTLYAGLRQTLVNGRLSFGEVARCLFSSDRRIGIVDRENGSPSGYTCFPQSRDESNVVRYVV
jgi:DNA-binding transcriptional LysR family regulator